jgi:hypothetical protein
MDGRTAKRAVTRQQMPRLNLALASASTLTASTNCASAISATEFPSFWFATTRNSDSGGQQMFAPRSQDDHFGAFHPVRMLRPIARTAAALLGLVSRYRWKVPLPPVTGFLSAARQSSGFCRTNDAAVEFGLPPLCFGPR